jgi:formylglycine-generating enzyme required for sulfatase activity
VWLRADRSSSVACLVAALASTGIATARDELDGPRAGKEKTVAGMRLCRCTPGKFPMGSPPAGPERRPGDDQIEVPLTRGLWAGKDEVTQGDWKRIVGGLPGPSTAARPEGDDYPVGKVNFAEAEASCRKLTESATKAGEPTAG